MKRKVTLAEVARAAGVSHQTVSNVINNRAVVKKATKELVLRHLKESGYRGNPVARSLKTNSSKLIGLVVPSMTNSMYAEVAQAIVRKAERRGYTVMMAVTERDAHTELCVANTMIDHNVAGILISPSDPDAAASRHAFELEVPFIEMLNRSEGVSCDVFEADNQAGGRMATEHLIECGHSDIGFIAGIPNSTGRDRFDGYKIALEDAGHVINSELVVRGDYTRSGGRAACSKLLDSDHVFTALFCASDIMAYGVMDELSARGLRIPQDIALIGFDDMEMSSLPGVNLSSISFKPASLAGKAIDRLITKITSLDISEGIRHDVEPCSLVIRNSTRESIAAESEL